MSKENKTKTPLKNKTMEFILCWQLLLGMSSSEEND